ncbi:MAG: glycoside hydrolase family 25 [Clostridiales bacterium]|nr:glycoside hydrolase family 25 [Clostridiales bacterium]
MSKIFNIIIDYIKNNRKLVLFYSIAAILLTFSFIYLVSIIVGMKSENDIGTTVAEGVSPLPTQAPTITPTIELEEENFDDIEDPEIVEETVKDDQDPQVQGTSGIEMNIQDIDRGDSVEETITYGVDIAKWQGVVDWKKVKKAGIDFAMIRVGYRTLDNGIIVEDPYAKYNLQQASKNGMKIGVYFFSTALNKAEAKEEAAWVADFIAPYPITYPVAYNCEGFTDPNNRQYGMTKDNRSDVAISFLDYMQEQGYTPMFYASKNELEENAQWNTDMLSRRYRIWVAHYPDSLPKDMKSSYSGKHAMWQYTSKGKVPGVDKPVDLNIAYFGYEKTAKPKVDTPQEEVSADPTALINFKEVNETVTAKIETNLRKVPSTENPDSVVAILKNGDTATRIGIGDNGWSRLEYKGEILFAVSSYLTTDLEYNAPKPTPEETGPVYQKVNEEVTAKEKTNLRSEPSTASDETIEAVLYYGDIAIRTGIGVNGWSRVEYNGQTLYAISRYLTTDLDYQDNIKPTIDNPEAGITFTKVNEKVTAKEITNLRIVPTTELEDTVAVVLKNGDIAIRTGIGDNGWSRLEYDGRILYAVTSYLKVVE